MAATVPAPASRPRNRDRGGHAGVTAPLRVSATPSQPKETKTHGAHTQALGPLETTPAPAQDDGPGGRDDYPEHDGAAGGGGGPGTAAPQPSAPSPQSET
jgi:hypothetical protein